ncbi:MAG: hypothetical protein J6A36_02505 [Clostridia bacterium]|nr:hypothetical protein [Clostridia bacterium]
MGDTRKDDPVESKQHQLETSANRNIPTPITLGNFLLALLVIVIIATGSLVYYMIRKERKDYEQYNNLVQNVLQDEKNSENNNDNVSNNETIKDIIDSATNVTTETNTVDAVDATNRKVMNENLIVLYNGLILDTTAMKKTELKYIDNSDQYKDKYVITYYNYESFGFKESKLGTISTQIYDGLVKIENVGKIAISESYEAIPREIKVVNAIPTIVSDKNPKIGDFDSKKAIITDLDGNGTEEYVLILANKTTGYSKIVLLDSSGTKVADLAYIEKSKWESVTTEEYHLSLSNVEIIDIDNDGIMEILIELPRYEGDPSISLLKYKNGELQGDTNIECSLLP